MTILAKEQTNLPLPPADYSEGHMLSAKASPGNMTTGDHKNSLRELPEMGSQEDFNKFYGTDNHIMPEKPSTSPKQEQVGKTAIAHQVEVNKV